VTRKHFELIAYAVKVVFDQLGHDCGARRILAERLASELYGTNPRFDRERFLRACGV
jgi:hypothetical protein